MIGALPRHHIVIVGALEAGDGRYLFQGQQWPTNRPTLALIARPPEPAFSGDERGILIRRRALHALVSEVAGVRY